MYKNEWNGYENIKNLEAAYRKIHDHDYKMALNGTEAVTQLSHTPHGKVKNRINEDRRGGSRECK